MKTVYMVNEKRTRLVSFFCSSFFHRCTLPMRVSQYAAHFNSPPISKLLSATLIHLLSGTAFDYYGVAFLILRINLTVSDCYAGIAVLVHRCCCCRQSFSRVHYTQKKVQPFLTAQLLNVNEFHNIKYLQNVCTKLAPSVL